MSRPEYNVRVDYIGTGALKTYSFDFKIVDKTHLKILSTDTDGNTVFEVRGNDLTKLSGCTLDGDDGGSITLIDFLPLNQNLILLLADDAPTQPKRFGAANQYTMKQIEEALDWLSGQIQHLRYMAGRSITVSDNQKGDFSAIVPPIEADSVLVGNADGDGYDQVNRSEFKGDKGDQGDAATLDIGTITTLLPGQPATAVNSGTINDAIFDLGIPQGLAATIQVGTVTDVPHDQPATITNVGTAGAAILNFEIPAGEDGDSTSLITVTNTAPNDAIGADGDLWINSANGNLYQKAAGTYVLKGNITGPPGGVNSWKTRTGAVVPAAGDYTAAEVTFVPTAEINVATVQLAIEEVQINLEAVEALLVADIADLQADKQDNLPAGTNGQILMLAGGVPDWVDQPAALPVGGTIGQALLKNSSTDGDAGWATLPSGLPSQATHSGKFLTTNGSAASWSLLPSPIGATALQTLAAAATIAVGTNPIESVLVEGTGGVTSVVLPVPTIDRQILHVMGASNTNPVRIPQGTNVYQREATYTLNNMDSISYMARTSLGRWIQIGGNV